MGAQSHQSVSKTSYSEVSRLLDDFHNEIEQQSGDPVGLTAVARKFRDKLLSTQDFTATCAYAINIAIRSRGGKLDDAHWESFRKLAEQAQKPSRDRRLEEERRRMRALAVLWALWSSGTVTYYKWELYSLKMLTQLAKVATLFPRWPEFVRNLNYVMLLRHERSLSGGRTQPIGRHHPSSRVQDESSPLEACDLDRLLRKPPSEVELQTFSGRVKHWIRGTYRYLKVHDKDLSEYPNIRHFRIQLDRYGMLVRHTDPMTISETKRRSSRAPSSSVIDEAFTSSDKANVAYSEEKVHDTAKNNQREESIEIAEERLLEVSASQPPTNQESKRRYGEVGEPLSSRSEDSEPETTITTASPLRPSTVSQAQSSPDAYSPRSGSRHEAIMSYWGGPATLPQQAPALPYYEIPAISILGMPNASPHEGAHLTAKSGSGARFTGESSTRSELNPLYDFGANDQPQTGNESQPRPLDTFHFDAEYRSLSSDRPMDPEASRPFPVFEDNAACDLTQAPSQSPASAMSPRSFSSIVDYSRCQDTLDGFESHISKPVENSHVDFIPNVMDRTQEYFHVRAHTLPVSFDTSTPRETFLPTPRAMSLSPDTVPSSNTTPSYPLSSTTDGVLDSQAVNKHIVPIDDGISDIHAANESLVARRSSSKEATSTTSMQTPQNGKSSVPRSNEDCSVCNGTCTVVQVPTDIDGELRNTMFEFAHKSYKLERSAPDEETRTWLREMTFVANFENSRGERECHLLAQELSNHTGPIFGRSVLTWSSLSNKSPDDTIKPRPRLAHDVQGGEVSVFTRKYGYGKDALYGSTRQQARDEITYRRRKKRGLRSQLLRKFKSQVQRVQPISRGIMTKEYGGQDDRNREMQNDVHEEMREAEQHTLSTTGVVQEVYHGSVADGSDPVGKVREEGEDGERGKDDSTTVEDAPSTAITALADREIEMSAPAGTDDPSPGGNTGSHGADGNRSRSKKILSHHGDARLISNKRKLPNQSGETDGQLRLTDPKHAQRKSWEPLRETVDSVRRIWCELDHARIYVTSGTGIAELAAQQHPTHQRLWSWSKDNRDGYERQIGRLLRDRKFGFQVVCSDVHTRQYCSLDYMEFWKAYFEFNKSPYWLAVLTPWRRAPEFGPKVRKTFGG